MRSLGELTLYGVKLALVNHPVAVLVELRSVILQQLRSVATCGTMLQQAVSDCNMLSCGSHLRQHLLSRHLPVSVHVLDQALKLGLVAGDHLLHDSMVAMFLARLCSRQHNQRDIASSSALSIVPSPSLSPIAIACDAIFAYERSAR